MAPNANKVDAVLREDVDLVPDEETQRLTEDPSQAEYKAEIVWPNVYWYTFLHLSAIYGLYLGIFQAKWATVAVGKEPESQCLFALDPYMTEQFYFNFPP
jgi:hypothetical protein